MTSAQSTSAIQPHLQEAIAKATQAAAKNDWDAVMQHLLPHEPELQHDAQACYLVGIKLLRDMNQARGIEWLKRAIHLNGSHSGALYALGYQLFQARRFEEAVRYLERASQCIPDNVLTWVYLAHSYVESSLIDKALAAYLKAAALDPAFERMDYYLANVYLFLGEREKARHHAQAALAAYPEDMAILWKYVIVFDYDISDAVLKQSEQLFERLEQSQQPRCDIAFALAGVYEKRGQLERACDYYEKANALRAEQEPYNPAPRKAVLAQVREAVADWPERQTHEWGTQERGAIFIVGMPRSGTTLLQQMLAAHSQVKAAGELRILKQIFYDIAPSDLGAPFPQLLSALTPEASRRYGEHYLRELRRYASAPFLIDKMPSNAFYAPMIRLILPKAVVFYLRRDPIDTCWSLWRQGFEPGHAYSYAADRIADYYADAEAQMAYYLRLFPDFIHEVSYEALVADPQTEARRLIALCGLDWEEAILQHHTQKPRIKTASVNQASQPIYTRAQRSWEPLKHRLRPLIEALHARGIETCVSRGEVTI